MAEPDYSKWTLEKAEPGEYAGWTLHPVETPPAEPSTGEAIKRGLVQGGTLGFSDELAGLARAAFLPASGVKTTPQALDQERALGIAAKGPDIQEEYRKGRDEERALNSAAQQAHALAYGGAQFAGSIPTSFVPGLNVAKGAGLLKAVGTGALGGGLAGLGASEGKTATDDALATLTGAGIGGGAGLLGYGMNTLSGGAANKARLARADSGELANKVGQKVFRQSRSAVGGETTAVMNSYKHAVEVATNAGGVFTPEMVAAAQQRLKDPEFVELVRDAAQGSLDQGVDRLRGSLATARNVFESAKKGITPEGINEASDQLLANPIRNQVVPRLKHMASRAIPVAAGTAVGGVPGAMVGAATAATLGHPGTTVANMLKHPGFRNMAFGGLSSLESGLGSAASRSAVPVSLVETPRIAAMIAALRKPKEPDYSAWTLDGAPP